jgi:hypothetical protein
MRRIPITFSILFLLSACHWHYYKQSHFANPCPGTEGHSVCIDPATLKPTPDPVHVRHGQYVHFFFTSPGHELNIDSAVLQDQHHDNGHAWGKVKVDAPYGKSKYSIRNLTTKRTNDPTIIIDP